MVRLKVENIYLISACGRFQFQNGSIKSIFCQRSFLKLVAFQFQNGSIKSVEAVLPVRYLQCFNSKMVRLKARTNKNKGNTNQFQFQNGSIKRLATSASPKNQNKVSIPKWFD